MPIVTFHLGHHSHRRIAYAAVEMAMRMLDDDGDEKLADALRDALDPIWRSLTAEERTQLNARSSERTSGKP